MSKLSPLFASLILLGLAAAPASAAQDDVIVLRFSQNLSYESNLYRLADDADPARGARSDLVSQTGAGIDFSRQIGLQHVRAGVGLTANRYRENDHLDFEGIDLNGRWDWAYGRATSGELAVLQTQTLSSFDDFAGEQRAVNTYRRLSFTADRLLAPEWLAGIGASMASSDYSGETRPTAEYEERGFSLRAGYRPRAGDQLTLSLNRTHGEYPNRTATLAADRAYDQQDLRLDGRWQITSATRLAGYIGYTGRSYDFADNRDFDGMTGRVELDWAVTAKAAISAVVRREIGAQEDLVDNFVVTDSLLLRPRWSPTEKIALSTEFELRKRDYGGDPGLGGVVPSDRSEELRRFGVFANYQLRRTVSLGAGLRWENRSSDDERRDYSADSASLTARVAF